MERNGSPFLQRFSSYPTSNRGLSLLFTTLCIIDLFGVFPVMTLPRPIIECGWLGLPVALGVFGLQVYTAILLGRCWVIAEHIYPNIISKSRYPYSALVEMSFGKRMGKFVTFLLDVAVFGGGVPNLLVASQNLQLLGLKVTDSSVDISYCYWMISLGIILCPIMWLGSPKDMKWVAVTSVSSVIGVAILTWTCMLIDKNAPATIIIPEPSWESYAIAYGILAFQFDIHPMVLTVQVDMKDKSQLGYAIIWSFTVTGGLFMVSTVIAMVKYGTAIRYNVLQTLPASGMLYFDLLLVTVQICLSMVVGGSALFQDIEDRLRIPREFNWKRCATRSTLMLFTVLIGEFVPRFDLIMGLIGGALTGPLMFVFPPLLYAKYRYLQDQHRDYLGIAEHSYIPEAVHSEVMMRETRPLPYNPYYRPKFYYDEIEVGLSDSSMSDFQGTGFDGEFESLCAPRDVPNYGSLEFRSSEDEKSACSLKKVLCKGTLTKLEGLLILCIIILGTLATCGATYYSVRGAILYAKFTPACFP